MLQREPRAVDLPGVGLAAQLFDEFGALREPGGPLASVGNFTPALEFSVDWISDLLGYMLAHGYDYVDAAKRAEDGYTEAVRKGQVALLMGKVSSWFTGVKSNIEGQDTPRVLTYVGSAQAYRKPCHEVREREYRELEFRSASARIPAHGPERAARNPD